MFPYVNVNFKKTQSNNIYADIHFVINVITLLMLWHVYELLSALKKNKNHCHNFVLFISFPVSTCVSNWNIIKQITRPAWCVFRAFPFRRGGSP